MKQSTASLTSSMNIRSEVYHEMDQPIINESFIFRYGEIKTFQLKTLTLTRSINSTPNIPFRHNIQIISMYFLNLFVPLDKNSLSPNIALHHELLDSGGFVTLYGI